MAVRIYCLHMNYLLGEQLTVFCRRADIELCSSVQDRYALSNCVRSGRFLNCRGRRRPLLCLPRDPWQQWPFMQRP